MLNWFSMLIKLLVPETPLSKFLQQIIIKTRNGVLLVIPLIATDVGMLFFITSQADYLVDYQFGNRPGN